MERELTHDEAAELLGAYALDAVEADERDAIEHHLNECPRCRAEVALTPDGTGFLVADKLPVLPNDRTYQLWALANGQKISAGVLGAQPRVVAFRYAPSGLSGFAVTNEEAGGVVSTQNAPVVLGTLQRT